MLEDADKMLLTEISATKEADAYFVADAEYGDYWVFDLFAGYDYDIFEEPQSPPYSDFPNTKKSDTENPPQLNTKASRTKRTNLDKKDKREEPNYFSQYLIEKEYIPENELFLTQYNYMLEQLENEYKDKLKICKVNVDEEPKRNFYIPKVSVMRMYNTLEVVKRGK